MTTSVTRSFFTKQHQICKTETKITKTTACKNKTDFFLVSDLSCPKTDGLRPHHWKTARKNQGTCFCRFCTRFLTRALEGSHVGLPEHLQSAGRQFNTLLRLRNDLYCVEWDVKLYCTIPSTPCSALLGNDFGQVTHRCTQYLLCYDRMAL